MIEATAIIAIVLGCLIVIAVTPRKPSSDRREALRRQLEAAQRDHRATKDIRKLYVQATCEELRQ